MGIWNPTIWNLDFLKVSSLHWYFSPHFWEFFGQRKLISKFQLFLCIWMVKSCPIIKWSIIQLPFGYRTKFSMVFRPPFEYRTPIWMVVWIPNYHLNTEHLNTGQVKVCYSDVSVIKIPTVKAFCTMIPTYDTRKQKSVSIYYSQNGSTWEYLCHGRFRLHPEVGYLH